MPSLTPRENYLRTLRHQENEYVPYPVVDTVRTGGAIPAERGTPENGQVDGFGVRWVASDSAVGGLIPEPGKFILTDITRWKKDITIPNLDDLDWQKLADTNAAAKTDREQKAVGFAALCGPWERLAALMGFEEAMIAMMEEPEAAYELLGAITDFKIKLAEKVATYYKTDTFTNFDDIATERHLFIAPETYRALIKPHHKRLNDAIKNFGLIPIQHTCGKAELCVEDYIETGAEAWNTVQPTNDIKNLLDKYGNRFCFDGGYDSTGKPGRSTATIEEIVAEVERCFRDYGNKKGFIFSGFVLASTDDVKAAEKAAAIMETANRLRFAGK